MPVHMPAEATCDHCGKTAPCKLDCAFVRTSIIGDRSFQTVGVAIRGLETWFWKNDGVACSETCKDTLAKDPKHAGFSDPWAPCR